MNTLAISNNLDKLWKNLDPKFFRYLLVVPAAVHICKPSVLKMLEQNAPNKCVSMAPPKPG